MNQETRNFILQVSQVQMIYESNRDSLDNVKCFGALLPLISEMLDMCHLEFESSIAYIKDYNSEKERKKLEVEKISKRIKDALHLYSTKFKKKIHEEEKEFLSEGILHCTDEELLLHVKKMKELVEPVQHFLVHFGISNALLKEYEHMIHDLIPAMPLNFEEIETHKKRYHSVRKSIREIENYLVFH